ncbi:TPA_exp: DnaJ domain protein [Trichophyton benhamiae CBS 112371]|uniref:DnaJ domain protein n=1 Tax=Arthroderma benhamiae (strain ATCC MYA-4681 / CBS 112371) TaxID=663331 RepID=D4AKG7_ARTBC|nr:DnaJ domain protein [Trichophyton benhamiae CBS 112371]EFE35876.1 DnaJ domain protein [Trichophyton benhamiae CBS 112371]DAA78694.1 TPA_exp: DnaJ domain protein [Trichophyton benhamiae CBS 112371]
MSSDGVDCEEPPCINPYEVLGVAEQAGADEIRSAYRKKALRHHPDKVSAEDKDAAHRKFQEIAFAYAILSDERRRRRYDTTGNTAESLDLEDDDFSWTDFYREQFSVMIDGTLLDKFKQEYKGSDEERADLLRVYEECKGQMDGIYERVMASDVLEDDDRFRALIRDAIEAGEVADYPAFTEEPAETKRARRRAARKEAGEAMEMARELGVEEKLFGSGSSKKTKGGKSSGDGGEDALMALIQQRQKSRGESFLANLEAKYAPKKHKHKHKRAAEDDEPPEEAFHKPRTRTLDRDRGHRDGQNQHQPRENNAKNKSNGRKRAKP